MVNCNIKLSNSRGFYTAGEVIQGTIELILNHPKKLRGLYFVVYGAAKCHWTETESYMTSSGRNQQRTVDYEGKDVYLNTRTYLFGAKGANAIEIPGGIHSYNFECLIPHQIPASFDSKHGHIYYRVEAVVDIPWAIDSSFKLPFNVVRVDDLNYNPGLKIPVKSEEIKTFCCLFCESKPLLITVTIPYSGYTLDQMIPVVVEYNNQSGTKVHETIISIRRIIHYNSYSPERKTKIESMDVVSCYKAGVGETDCATITSSISLPRILVNSNSRYCNVVQIYYVLVVEARVDEFYSNVQLSIPITIGSIPLNFDAPPIIQQTPVNIFVNPSAPYFQPDSFPVASIYDPPPSFDEVMKLSNGNFDNPRDISNSSAVKLMPAGSNPTFTPTWSVSPQNVMPSAPPKM